MMRHVLLCAAALMIFLISQAPNAVLNDLIMACLGGLLFVPNEILAVDEIFRIIQVLPMIILIPMFVFLASALLALAELEG